MISEGLGIAAKLRVEEPIGGHFYYKKGYYLRNLEISIKAIITARSLEIDRSLDDNESVAVTLYYMAENFHDLENYKDSINLALECHSLEENIYNSNDIILVETLDLLIRSYKLIGNYESALVYAEKAQQILEWNNSKDIVLLVDYSWEVADLLFQLSLYRQSLKAYLEMEIHILNHWKDFLSPNPEKNLDIYFQCLRRIGICYEEIYNPFAAIKYYENALKVVEENDLDKSSKFSLLNDLGNAFAELGKDEKALISFEKAVEISKQDDLMMSPYPNLANLYYDIGDKTKSRNYSELALKEAKEISGIYSFDYVIPLMNMGQHLMEDGNYSEALKLLNEVQGIINSGISFPVHLENSFKWNLLFNFLSLYDWSGNDEMALEYAKKCLKESISTYGENHPRTSFSYDRLALCLWENNQSELALKNATASSEGLYSFLTGDLPRIQEAEKMNFIENALDGRGQFDMLATIGEPKELSKAILQRKGLALESILLSGSDIKKILHTNVISRMPSESALLEYIEYDEISLIDGIQTINTFYGCVLNIRQNTKKNQFGYHLEIMFQWIKIFSL